MSPRQDTTSHTDEDMLMSNVPSSSMSVIQTYMEKLAAEEQALLRDTLFLLQGINSDRLTLDADDDGSLHVSSPAASVPPWYIQRSIIGSGALDVLQQCGQAGWLYHRIRNFTRRPTESAILRALQMAAHEQLQVYLEFLARLGQELQQQQQQQAVAPTDLSLGSRSHRMTLRGIWIQARPVRQDLLSVAMVVDGVAHLNGPDVLTALGLMAQHENVRHRAIVQTLLAAAATPWWSLLQDWLTRGSCSLSDASSSSDFFVTQSQAVDDKDLWSHGYVLHADRVPPIFDVNLVEPAFQIGKGINYIRRVLQDGAWSMEELDDKQVKEDDSATPPALDNGIHAKTQLQKTRRTIQLASTLVHSHILESLRTKHALMDHMMALTQFLLVGQGDFYSALMDGLHAEYGFYDNHSKIVRRYSVASIVDTALRNTNANEFDDQIVGRLHVKLQIDGNKKDDDIQYLFGSPIDSAKSVWDLIGFDYDLPDPLVAIVDAACMKDYQHLFHYLFGVKRVEYMLNATWRMSAVLHHSLQMTALKGSIKNSNNPAFAQANSLLRQVSMTRQAMMHFVGNLKSYLFFEVLEAGWKSFQRKMKEATTLNEIVGAHAIYLRTIKRKSMLPMLVNSSEGDGSTGLGKQVHELLKLAKDFCDHQRRIFASALAAADRSNEKRRLAEKRLENDRDWGFNSHSEISEQETFFGLSDVAELESLGDLSRNFKVKIKQLLVSIDQKLHGGAAAVSNDHEETTMEDRDDLDSLRFLKFQLAGNGFYE